MRMLCFTAMIAGLCIDGGGPLAVAGLLAYLAVEIAGLYLIYPGRKS